MSRIEKTNIREFFKVPDLAYSDLRTYEECCEQFSNSVTQFIERVSKSYKVQHHEVTSKTDNMNIGQTIFQLSDHTYWQLGKKKFHYFSGHSVKIIFDPRKRKVIPKAFQVVFIAHAVYQKTIDVCDFDTFEDAIEYIEQSLYELALLKMKDLTPDEFLAAFVWVFKEFDKEFPKCTIAIKHTDGSPVIRVEFNKSGGHFEIIHEKDSGRFIDAYTDGDYFHKGNSDNIPSAVLSVVASHYRLYLVGYMEKYRLVKPKP